MGFFFGLCFLHLFHFFFLTGTTASEIIAPTASESLASDRKEAEESNVASAPPLFPPTAPPRTSAFQNVPSNAPGDDAHYFGGSPPSVHFDGLASSPELSRVSLGTYGASDPPPLPLDVPAFRSGSTMSVSSETAESPDPEILLPTVFHWVLFIVFDFLIFDF